MPDLDDGIPRLSRRTVLRGAAGAGAAGLAASALASVALPAAAATKAQIRTTRGPAGDGAADEAIVVHVRDAASGEIDVFRGTTQIRLHDRDLAARLVRVSSVRARR
jgi:nitrous oxide reductase